MSIESTYDRRAAIYDLSTRLYPFIGFRFEAYRRRGIELLHLQPGDQVVDLGCGTGLNFPHILERIGPEGKLIGMDVSQGMLARAQKRAAENVTLVHASMDEFEIPEGTNRILTTGALGFSKNPEAVVQEAAAVERLVIVDLKHPEAWPDWLFKLYFKWMGKPFAVTPGYVVSRPWETVAEVFPESEVEEAYGGAIYMAVGRNVAQATACPRPS